MADLELVGLHADGEHLVLIGPDGHRHRIAIDDALRAAVRHDRPRLEQVRAASLVRPREIQSRIRAGESAADIARDAGVPVDQIRRYEGPVTAERNWVAEQARLIPLGRENGAPRLGELVIDRLAHRGIDPAELSWTAVRRPGEGWELVLAFRAGDLDREARWSVDVPSRALHALDDESRSLSEADLGSPDPRRHLSSVQSRVYDVEVDTEPPGPAAEPASHWASSRPRRAERPADGRGPDRGDRAAQNEGIGRTEGERTSQPRTDDEHDHLRSTEAGHSPDAQPKGGADAEAPAGPRAARPESTSDAEVTTNPESTPPPSARGESPRSEADLRTAELLEGLRASRGIRQEIGRLDEEDEDDGPWAAPPSAPTAPEKERPPATVRQLRPLPVAAPESTTADAPEATPQVAEERVNAGAVEPRPHEGMPAEAPRAEAPPEEASRAAAPPEEAPPAAARPAKARPAQTRPAARTRPGAAPAGQRTEPRPQPGQERSRTKPAGADSGAGEDQETSQLLPVLPPGDPARKTKSKSRRTSVPSWDEIVFGSKPE